MSADRQRSFFATTTGVVTLVAGLVTAVVGILTIGVQLGWLGSDEADNGTGNGSSGGDPATSTAVLAQFSVDPSRVAFEVLGPLLGAKESLVTVRNTSTTVPIDWRAPSVEGPDRAMFKAIDVSCGARLDPGKSCEVRVGFVASRGGDYQGRLVLQPENGPAREVQLVGKAVL